MSWGLENRLSRVIRPADGRCVMLAVDHGYFQGVAKGLEDPRAAIAPLAPHADSLMLTRGVLRTSVDPAGAPPIVLRVSGGNTTRDEDLSNETITVGIEECIRLSVSAMALSIFVGAPHSHDSIANLGKLVDEGERFGIPVLAVTAVGRDMKRDERYLKLACRIAAEQGAHIVKTYYCDDFERVAASCPVPIVVAGGTKLEEREAIELAYNSVTHGAIGVDMGRNIFQSDCPVGMIKAVNAVVHGGASVDDAYAVYEDEKRTSGAGVSAVSDEDVATDRKV